MISAVKVHIHENERRGNDRESDYELVMTTPDDEMIEILLAFRKDHT